MYKRYFRMKGPGCKLNEIEWIEMTGSEFYRFVNSPKGQRRHFIDMDDVVLEASEADARSFKAEQNHHYYIQAQEEGWSTLSLYAAEDDAGCSGEEIARDETQDVEAEAMMRIETAALRKALECLDLESYQMIHALYLADTRKTLRQLSLENGIPVMTLQDRKKKALAFPGSMSISDIDRRLDELNKEFQALFADSKDGGFMKHAEEFKRISADMTALKKQRADLLEQQNSGSAASQRIAGAMEILSAGSADIQWDESTIRQLVDTVKVLSANRIRIYLQGGIEIEQELVD